MRFSCPCCGYFTYSVPPKDDVGFICPVCFWENDPFLKSQEEPSDSNHHISLRQARENYQDFQACERSMLPYVRSPHKEEESDACEERNE